MTTLRNEFEPVGPGAVGSVRSGEQMPPQLSLHLVALRRLVARQCVAPDIFQNVRKRVDIAIVISTT
jgi:hypothetical protein